MRLFKALFFSPDGYQVTKGLPKKNIFGNLQLVDFHTSQRTVTKVLNNSTLLSIEENIYYIYVLVALFTSYIYFLKT